MTLHNDTPQARKKVKEMVRIAGGRISIMPAIGATGVHVIDEIVRQTGVREIHIGRAVRTPHQYTGAIDPQKIRQIILAGELVRRE
jgi:copper homeostasis protein CutC